MKDLLRIIIADLVKKRRSLIASLRQNPSGLTWCENHTDIVDEILRAIYENATKNAGDNPPLALIATGGYGRRELSPYSDLDITVVPGDESSQELDDVIRQLFQDIHSVFHGDLRMEVGYAYRLISDSPGLDAKTRTGLLDMRILAGSHDLFRRLEVALEESFSAGEFILNKTREREEMFRKYHDSPLVVEPHLKEGAGGMRCFHCANWLRLATGERAARPPETYDTIVQCRNLLHLVAGRHQDSLTRQKQHEIAEVLGVDVRDFMSNFSRAAEQIHAYYRRATEKIKESRFPLSPGVVAVQGEVRWSGGLDAGDAAVGVAIATQLGLHVSDLQVSPHVGINGPAAMYAFSTGELTIRNLDRCGLLSQLLPQLTECRTVMPDDSVHQFTVFEHTLRAIRVIDNLPESTFFGDISQDVTDFEPLYLALLLHDVARGESEENHPELGAEIAAKVCREWGIAESQAEMTTWLIRNHLVMSRFVRVRDIQNPNTIKEFATAMVDLDHLRLLTLMTYADVRAVAESAWTPALQTFMRELFERTRALLEGQYNPSQDPAVYRQRLLRQLKTADSNEESVNQFVSALPSYYLVSTPPAVVRLHMEFVRKAAEGEPTIELFHRQDIHATELTVCAKDSQGLLSRLLGVFYAYDLSVSGIRATTTVTTPQVVLDVFTLNFGGKAIPAATCHQVNTAILLALENESYVDELLRSRGKDPERGQRLLSHSFVPGTPSILEIRSPRGRGMPYRVSRMISRQRWNIVSARVGQWAGNATAAFYLTGEEGAELDANHVDLTMSALIPKSNGSVGDLKVPTES